MPKANQKNEQENENMNTTLVGFVENPMREEL